ncbi:MAG: Uma2 family endonuclease [Chitinophagaceae bacterium]|jgi:Uma2 family endonuclease|nr:Uma2 family endonuclease [Chitinophagaceae bacterium]
MSLAASIPPRYTIKDYQQWKGDWELINGYPYAMSPSPYSQHQLMASSFELAFHLSLRDQKSDCQCNLFRELDWIIDENNVVRPDLAIVCVPVEKKGFITHPPVLIVEVFSDATRMKDRNIKFRLYESAGVKYYLMADPDANTIEIFELTDNQYKEAPDLNVFSLHKGCGITVDFEEIFQF